MSDQINDERVVLTKEQAIAMLPDSDMIHTFRQGAIDILIGADWNREDVLKAINKYEVEITGERAQSRGHGMAFKDEYGWVFVETKQETESHYPQVGCMFDE